MEQALIAARKKAQEFFALSSRYGGVVIVYEGVVCGWVDQLRDPGHWTPGSIAIDQQGNCWEAQGGTDSDGAERWQPLA